MSFNFKAAVEARADNNLNQQPLQVKNAEFAIGSSEVADGVATLGLPVYRRESRISLLNYIKQLE